MTGPSQNCCSTWPPPTDRKSGEPRLLTDPGSGTASLPGSDALRELQDQSAALAPAERLELLLFVAQSLRRERTGVLRPRRYSATEVAAWLAEDQAVGDGRLTSPGA